MGLNLSIWDHNSEVGYHFRQNSGNTIWESVIKSENNAVRSLEQQALEGRIRLYPLSKNSLAVIVSKRIHSDGRPAVKTASIMFENSSCPVRWKTGIVDLAIKGLETTSNGGSLDFDLGEFTLSSELLPYIPTQQTTETSIFSGFSLDAVMMLWSMLPPEQRCVTEVILGAVDDSETLSGHIQYRWIIKPGIELATANYQHRLDLISQDSTTFGSELEHSSIVADSTGVSSNMWMNVVDSEMLRRGIPISNVDSFLTRIHVSKHDAQESRRAVWRELVIEMLKGNPLKYKQLFFEQAGMPTAEEIQDFNEEEQFHTLSPGFLSVEHSASRSYILRTISSYYGCISTQNLLKLFSLVDVNRWWIISQSQPNQNAELVRFLSSIFRKDYQIVHHFLKKAISTHIDQSIGADLLEAIIDSNIVLPSEEFLYMLKDMNVPISERGAVRLNTLISQLFLLNWDDSRKVSKWLSSIHLNQKQPLLNSLNDFESWIGQDSIKKGLFYQYLIGLTENMENSSSYQTNAEVSLRIALHSSVDSFWFSEVFRRGSVSQIRLLLESKNMSLDKVPTTTLNRLQSGNTELLGWPSPYKKISSATKMQTRARLAIQPTRLDKANKMFGLSCHITFWLSTITFVLFLLDLIGIMNLNLKPPSMIDPPYYGLELPRYADFFSLTFALILSIHSYLYSKVTKKLR
jgi:hypothetical protein